MTETANPNNMTVVQLRQALEGAGISAPSRLRRPELIGLYERHIGNRAAQGAPAVSSSATRSRRGAAAQPTTSQPSQRQPRGRPSAAQAAATSSVNQAATPRTRVHYGEPGYSGMTKAQLQEELRRRGMPTSGSRELLIQRLAGPTTAASVGAIGAAPATPAAVAGPLTPIAPVTRRSRASRQAAAPAVAAQLAAPAATTSTRRRGRPSGAMAAPSPAARSPAATTVVPALATESREIPLIPLNLPPPPTPVLPPIPSVPGPVPSVTAPAVGSPRTSSSAMAATTGFPASPRPNGTTSPRPGATSPRLSISLPSTGTLSESGTTLSPRLVQRAPGTLSPLRGSVGVGPAAGQGTANGRQRV